MLKSFQMNDILFDLQSDKNKFDWNQNCISDSGVIKKAFIFGANSSGKSYFLKAMTQKDCYAPNSKFKYVFELNGQEKVYEFSKDSNNEHVSQNLPMMFYVDMDQLPKKEDALIEHFILKIKLEQKLEKFLRHLDIQETIVQHQFRLCCRLGDHYLPFWDVISGGTKELVYLFFYLYELSQTKHVSLIVFDHFASRLHVLLAERLVEWFKNIFPDIQMIFCSHCTQLITNESFRPDCYFLMKQNNIQPMFPQTDIKYAHNLKKIYMKST